MEININHKRLKGYNKVNIHLMFLDYQMLILMNRIKEIKRQQRRNNKIKLGINKSMINRNKRNLLKESNLTTMWNNNNISNLKMSY